MTITELLLKGTTDSTLEEVNLNFLSQANQVSNGAIHGIFWSQPWRQTCQ